MTGYGIIQKSVMQDTSLSCTAKALYSLLCSYAGSSNTCYPKVETICHYMGVVEQTFYKHLKILKDKGYISTLQQKENGKFGRTLYTINTTPSPKSEIETKISKTEIQEESFSLPVESCTNKPCAKIACTINQGNNTNTNNTNNNFYKNQSISCSINKNDKDLTDSIKMQIDYSWFTENLPEEDLRFVNVSIILKQVFNEAMIIELVSRNPASIVPLPKQEKTEQKGIFLGVDEANKMLQAFREHELQALVYTTLYYGLRRSEVLGLKWNAIDFENCILKIQHTVVKNITIVAKDSTKSVSSHRTYPLLPEIKNILLQVKEQQKQNRELFGNTYINCDYIFV